MFESSAAMFESSMVLTVYDAISEGLPVAARCIACTSVRLLNPRDLAMSGYGRSQLAKVPFACECGSTQSDVVVG